MRSIIQTAELIRALFRIQGIAERKTNRPVLSHVLLQASSLEGGLVVRATNLEVAIGGTYPAEILEEGSVLVQAKQLYEIIKSLSASQVELVGKANHWLEISAGSSQFKLVGMPSQDFPEMAEDASVEMFSVPSDKFLGMVERTQFCVSTDENRASLGGIYCERTTANSMRMVSTDGHRLAVATCTFDRDIKTPLGVLVPRKALQELKRIVADPSASHDDIEIGFSSTAGHFKIGNVTLITRLIDAKFPDYKQVIPEQSKHEIKLSRVVVSDALKRVSSLSQGKTHGVRFVFEPGKLEIVAEDPEFGVARETIMLDDCPLELSIAFNARYIMDVLGLITEQGFVLCVSDDLSPTIIRPIEDQGFTAVVMPMRL